MQRLTAFVVWLLVATGTMLVTGCGSSNTGQGSTFAFSTASLPTATVGTAYSTTITATGGVAPYTYSLSGSAPSGFSFSSAGVLTGTPTATGSSFLVVNVTDAVGEQFSKRYTLNVVAQGTALAITTTTLPAGAVGSAYSATISASGGTTPYVFCGEQWDATGGAFAFYAQG